MFSNWSQGSFCCYATCVVSFLLCFLSSLQCGYDASLFFKVKVMLRPPVSLGVKHPLGTSDQIFFSCLTVAGLWHLYLHFTCHYMNIMYNMQKASLSPGSVHQICYLLIIPLHGPSRKHRLQKYLYCMRTLCSGNVFTEPLSGNGSTPCTIVAW
jgi:hypothetical protein